MDEAFIKRESERLAEQSLRHLIERMGAWTKYNLERFKNDQSGGQDNRDKTRSSGENSQI